MKIYVDEKAQEVRIVWGGNHGQYVFVTPGYFGRPALPELPGSVLDSRVVYETPGYRVESDAAGWAVLKPNGDVLVVLSDSQDDDAHKIADALNASKEN